MKKIKEFVDDTKWNKTVNLVKEFDELERKDGEDGKTFLTKFSSMETKLKNIGVDLPKMWLAASLLKKVKLSEMKKHNIMSTVNTDDNNEHILKDIKKKIRDLDNVDDPKIQR